MNERLFKRFALGKLQSEVLGVGILLLAEFCLGEAGSFVVSYESRPVCTFCWAWELLVGRSLYVTLAFGARVGCGSFGGYILFLCSLVKYLILYIRIRC